ncbi:helix-turn-helix domain-containing protein [Streptomyces aureocirculatus]|uniref:helix-turn-helix domain-containing protein n=1 Tax=Streptomyces aureocirculatus TaxID=67275 RepID=UPI0004C7F55D|nr:helix-turn-helix transcriptional regulator [Streptomyces aureocirculatus]
MPASSSPVPPDPGARLRELRLRRGLTQERLAERANLSLGVVRKLERGGTARLDNYHALARALGVRTSALFESGGPHSRTRGDDDNIDLLLLRQAVAPPISFSGRVTAPETVAPEPDLPRLRATAQEIGTAYHQDRYGEVAELLPGLVHAAHAAVRHYDSGTEHTEALRVRSDALQMAGRYLTQVRAYDLAHTALRDAIEDAVRVNDPQSAAAAVYQQGWLLMRQGRLDEAEQVSTATADFIEPRISRATRHSLGAWGKLLVHGSAAAARNNKPQTAREILRLGRTAGAALGAGQAVSVSSWGRFDWRTVAFQGIENQLVAQRPDRVLRLAERMPTPAGRKGLLFMRRHLLDVAQAHVMLRDGDGATDILWSLWAETPEWLRHQRMAEETFHEALGRSKRRHLTSKQRDLAAFFGPQD